MDTPTTHSLQYWRGLDQPWSSLTLGMMELTSPLSCVILELFLRITPLHQEYCSPHKQKMFCEKIFKIGVLKLCGNGFLDSLLYSLSVYNCTIVQLYISTCIAGNLKSHFRRVLRDQFWKFFHRTSCIYVGNIILDVMVSFAGITLVWNSLLIKDRLDKERLAQIFISLHQ